MLSCGVSPRVLGAVAKPPTIVNQTVQQCDLNQDGVVDFVVNLETEFTYCSSWGFYRTYWTLVPRGTNTVASVAAPWRPGEAIPVELAAPASWETNHAGILSWYVGITGSLLGAATNAFLAVRFAAADGVHLGWLEFQRRVLTGVTGQMPGTGPLPVATNVAEGWQPRPQAPLVVGERPSPPPPPSGDASETLAAIAPTGTIDFVLRVREWTNLTAGTAGVSAVLAGNSAWEVLATPGEVGGQAALLAEPLRAYTLIGATVDPARWASATNDIVLLDRRWTLQGTPLETTGPLDGRALLLVGVRERKAVGPSVGWLRFNDQMKFLGSGIDPVAGNPPGVDGSLLQRIDVDEDGVFDYEIRGTNWVDQCPLGLDTGAWVRLRPLGDNEIYASTLTFWPPPLDGGVLVSNTPAGSMVWRQRSLDLAVYAGYGPWRGTVDATLVEPGVYCDYFIGVRFSTPRGKCLGWLLLNSTTVLGWGYEPAPGTSTQTPLTLVAERSGGELALSWRRLLTKYAVEASPSLAPPAWSRIDSSSLTALNVPLGDAARFFRLVRVP